MVNLSYRIGMIVFSTYPSDNRVRRAAEALLESGMQVDVLCLSEGNDPAVENVRGVHVRRIKLTHKRSGLWRYFYEYGYFMIVALMIMSIRSITRRYHVLYIHNMPDILVFTAMTNKLFGARVVLDLHDPMPELYQTIYNLPQSHPAIRLLAFLEKISIGFADAAVTTNLAFYNLFVHRSCRAEKMHIVMNSPMEHLFLNRSSDNAPTDASENAPFVGTDRFELIYHGTIVHRHGLDIALRAVNLASEQIPGLRFHVYGDGAFLEEAVVLAKSLNMEDRVLFHGAVPVEQIVLALRRADLGIIPNRMSPFINTNFPTRIFECLIAQKPVITPRTKGVLDYFKEGECYFFEAGDARDLCEKIVHVYRHPEEMKEMVKKGQCVLNRHRWTDEKQKLVRLVRRVLHAR